jgi:hypothetical protein
MYTIASCLFHEGVKSHRSRRYNLVLKFLIENAKEAERGRTGAISEHLGDGSIGHNPESPQAVQIAEDTCPHVFGKVHLPKPATLKPCFVHSKACRSSAVLLRTQCCGNMRIINLAKQVPAQTSASSCKIQQHL